MKRRACLCCGYLTLRSHPGDFEICKVCFWEDDAVFYVNGGPGADYAGGANKISLNQAKANFASFGACEERFKAYVRAPLVEETV